jgi:hypothetical protein
MDFRSRATSTISTERIVRLLGDPVLLAEMSLFELRARLVEV